MLANRVMSGIGPARAGRHWNDPLRGGGRRVRWKKEKQRDYHQQNNHNTARYRRECRHIGRRLGQTGCVGAIERDEKRNRENGDSEGVSRALHRRDDARGRTSMAAIYTAYDSVGDRRHEEPFTDTEDQEGRKQIGRRERKYERANGVGGRGADCGCRRSGYEHSPRAVAR
jgi:hypothetical protein